MIINDTFTLEAYFWRVYNSKCQIRKNVFHRYPATVSNPCTSHQIIGQVLKTLNGYLSDYLQKQNLQVWIPFRSMTYHYDCERKVLSICYYQDMDMYAMISNRVRKGFKVDLTPVIAASHLYYLLTYECLDYIYSKSIRK